MPTPDELQILRTEVAGMARGVLLEQPELSLHAIEEQLGLAAGMRGLAFDDEGAVYAALLTADISLLQHRMGIEPADGGVGATLGAWILGLTRMLLALPGSSALLLRNFEEAPTEMHGLVAGLMREAEGLLRPLLRFEDEPDPHVAEILLLLILECVCAVDLRRPAGVGQARRRQESVDERLRLIFLCIGVQDAELLRVIDFWNVPRHG